MGASSLEKGHRMRHYCAMAGPIATARIDTPLGVIALSADDSALIGLRILPQQRGQADAPNHPVLADAMTQLRDWFDGNRTSFDLALTPLDTPEGQSLRAGISAIPYGETRTYGAVAAQTGSVARAVGQACKTNAFPIIIPCHRVTSASGPEFYSAGDGARTKSWLIDFEYAHLPPDKRTRLL
jgi:methylated-DNA-[protein]-cysteine S-methyltransferase